MRPRDGPRRRTHPGRGRSGAEEPEGEVSCPARSRSQAGGEETSPGGLASGVGVRSLVAIVRGRVRAVPGGRLIRTPTPPWRGAEGVAGAGAGPRGRVGRPRVLQRRSRGTPGRRCRPRGGRERRLQEWPEGFRRTTPRRPFPPPGEGYRAKDRHPAGVETGHRPGSGRPVRAERWHGGPAFAR